MMIAVTERNICSSSTGWLCSDSRKRCAIQGCVVATRAMIRSTVSVVLSWPRKGKVDSGQDVVRLALKAQSPSTLA